MSILIKVIYTITMCSLCASFWLQAAAVRIYDISPHFFTGTLVSNVEFLSRNSTLLCTSYVVEIPGPAPAFLFRKHQMGEILLIDGYFNWTSVPWPTLKEKAI